MERVRYKSGKSCCSLPAIRSSPAQQIHVGLSFAGIPYDSFCQSKTRTTSQATDIWRSQEYACLSRSVPADAGIFYRTISPDTNFEGIARVGKGTRGD